MHRFEISHSLGSSAAKSGVCDRGEASSRLRATLAFAWSLLDCHQMATSFSAAHRRDGQCWLAGWLAAAA